jgi:hypothetical protein
LSPAAKLAAMTRAAMLLGVKGMIEEHSRPFQVSAEQNSLA